jgi:hypothetical protein
MLATVVSPMPSGCSAAMLASNKTNLGAAILHTVFSTIKRAMPLAFQELLSKSWQAPY